MRAPSWTSAAALSAVSAALGCAQLLGFNEDYRAETSTGSGGSPGGSSAGGGSATGGGEGGAPVASGGSTSVALADFELPPGKLVYHRFSSITAGDGEMFVVDFPAGTVGPEIGATYGLCNPQDGSFSAYGDFLVVTAEPRTGSSCGAADATRTEVYLVDLANPPSVYPLTDNTGIPDVDPQYAADGSFVLFNRGGHLAEWKDQNDKLSTCPAETGSYCYDNSVGTQSKPVVTSDGLTICYQELDQEDADIFCLDRPAALRGDAFVDIRKAAAIHSHVYDGRPVLIDEFLYFQRWVSQSNTKKTISRKLLAKLDGAEERCTFCADEGSSYRDPTGLGDDYLVFSSDINGNGPTDLFVGRFGESDLLPLDHWIPGINSVPLYEYGASFWRQK